MLPQFLKRIFTTTTAINVCVIVDLIQFVFLAQTKPPTFERAWFLERKTTQLSLSCAVLNEQVIKLTCLAWLTEKEKRAAVLNSYCFNLTQLTLDRYKSIHTNKTGA